jgi:protein-tyrosine phosphatase
MAACRLVHERGQVEIERGQPAGGMRRQPHLDGAIDIAPFRMVVDLFGAYRAFGHEAERLGKAGEAERPRDRLAVGRHRPVIERLSADFNVTNGEFLTTHLIVSLHKWFDIMDKRRILFVCLGNICRSPLGEGILRSMAAARGLDHLVETDSAGTGGWHQGQAPDERSIRVARDNGIDISRLKARKLKTADFNTFDMIFAMDRSNLRDLVAAAPHDSIADIHLFMDFVSGEMRDVPDPYYGDDSDFEAVYSMLSTGCERLLSLLFKGRAAPMA